jgi:hypothetical protein
VYNKHLTNLRVSRMLLDWRMFNRKYQNCHSEQTILSQKN